MNTVWTIAASDATRRGASALTFEERRELCWATVTLDGRPARIGGAVNRYATVYMVGSALACEWAWDTVARIVANGGRFKS